MKISVVIPMYNAEKTIERCLQSVINQTVEDIEIIVINDGSTDNSGAICDRYSSVYQQIRVIHQLNEGRNKARMKGVDESQGEGILFVDSDDWLAPNSLHYLTEAISDESDFVVSNGNALGIEQKCLMNMPEFRHFAVEGRGSVGNPVGHLFRRNMLTNKVMDMPRWFYMGEDYIMWLRLVFANEKPVLIVPQNIYCIEASTTSSKFVWTAEYAQKIDDFRRDAIPQDLQPLYRHGMIKDAVSNLCSVALHQEDKDWRTSEFAIQLMSDIKNYRFAMPLKTRLFLALPSLRLRKWIVEILKK